MSGYRRLLILALLVGLGACEEETGFELVFDWSDRPDTPLFVSVEVTSADGIEARRGPEPLGASVEIGLDGLPVGVPLTVTVELRDEPSSASRVLYYGISEAFTLELGQIRGVAVVVPIRAAPTGALRVRDLVVLDEVRLFSASTQVTLELETDSSVAVALSNRPFSSERPGVDRPIDVLVELSPGIYETTWDLDIGRSPCGIANNCPRAVSARFRDVNGYESEVQSVELVVDTRPPSVVDSVTALELVPDPDNVLVRQQLPFRLASATAGTRVRLSFTLDEPIEGAPTVVARGAATGEVVSFAVPGEGDEVYEARVDATAADDTYIVLVTARDRAGNVATSTAATFVVDQTAPATPAVSMGESRPVVYHRAPFGLDGASVATYRVEGEAGAVEPNATVIIFAGPDPARDARLGETQADAEGGFDAVLVQTDAERVYVLVVDEAGNPSGPTASLVRDVRWTAGFGREVAGAPFGNPHMFEPRPWSLPTLRQPQRREVVPRTGDAGIHTDEAGGPGAPGWIATGRGGTWRSAEPIAPPPPRFWVRASRDAATGQILVFGGRSDSFGNCDGTGNELCGATFGFNGGRFSLESPASAPQSITPRESHGQAYDSRRGELVVFGGKGAVGCTVDDSSFCGDTWAFNENGWRPLAATATSTTPGRRINHAMAYDSTRSEVILFGGILGAPVEGNAADTWRWDGAAWSIASVAATSTAPPPRSQHAMAYDPIRQRVVLFGGVPPTPSMTEPVRLGDTWEWDGEQWAQRGQNATGPQPTARDDARLVFSPRLGRVVLFGGNAGPGERCDGGADQWCNALWSWTGDGWARIEPTFGDLPFPVGRTGHAMEIDRAGRLVVVGGRRLQTALAETGDVAGDCTEGLSALCTGVWAYDFDVGVWSELTGYQRRPPPPTRCQHAMAHLAGTGRILLFGGKDQAVLDCEALDLRDELGDAWLFDGSTWQPEPRTGPSERFGHRFYWDESAGRAVLVGGEASDFTTRFCDGSGSRQCLMFWDYSPTGGWSPSSRGFVNDLAGPLARANHGIAFDPATGRLIVANGRSVSTLADGWTLDRTGVWTEAPDAPPARYEAAMAWRSADGRAISFGGEVLREGGGTCPPGTVERVIPGDRGRCFYADTWIFDNGTWRVSTASADVPTHRSGATLVESPQEGAVVLFGGTAPRACDDSGNLRCNDVWLFRGERWQQVVDADLFGDGSPPARLGHAMVYDSDRRHFVMFGGGPKLSDTWVWRPPLDARPAHVARFAFGSAFGLGADAASRARDVEMVGASLAWDGQALADGAPTAPELLVWHRGRWRRAADASGQGLDGTQWQTTDAALLAEMVTGASAELGFAFTPAAAPADQDVEVATDWVQLTVDYRFVSNENP